MKSNDMATVLVGAAGIGTLCALLIYMIKEGDKAAKQFAEHKSEKLKDRDMLADVQKASMDNEKLTSEERCNAKRVLVHQIEAVKNARSISDFDEELSEFYQMIASFTAEDSVKASASILYYTEKLNAEIDRERRREELKASIQKTELITKAVMNSVKMYPQSSTGGLSINICKGE